MTVESTLKGNYFAQVPHYQTTDKYARSVVCIRSPVNSAISCQVTCVDGAMMTAY